MQSNETLARSLAKCRGASLARNPNQKELQTPLKEPLPPLFPPRARLPNPVDEIGVEFLAPDWAHSGHHRDRP